MAETIRAEGVILDLDGVLWRGKAKIPGAAEAVAALKRRGILVRFVSNNSLMGVEGAHEVFREMGIAAEREELILATNVLAREIARKTPRATVYLIGSDGFRKDLEDQGLRVIEEPEEIDYLVDYVVMGGDPAINMTKLTRALRCARQGARLAAANVDPVYPSADGPWPGSGALVAAVRAMTKRTLDLMAGKPEPDMLLMAVESMGKTPGDCIMVGDSLDSDIEAAKRANIRSVLVLTGNCARADVEQSTTKPDMIVDSVADLPARVSPE